MVLEWNLTFLLTLHNCRFRILECKPEPTVAQLLNTNMFYLIVLLIENMLCSHFWLFLFTEPSAELFHTVYIDLVPHRFSYTVQQNLNPIHFTRHSRSRSSHMGTFYLAADEVKHEKFNFQSSNLTSIWVCFKTQWAHNLIHNSLLKEYPINYPYKSEHDISYCINLQ